MTNFPFLGFFVSGKGANVNLQVVLVSNTKLRLKDFDPKQGESPPYLEKKEGGVTLYPTSTFS
jgi:hypothetical protein